MQKEKVNHLKIKDVFISILSVISVAIYPGLFLLFNNIEEAYLVDILPISGLFILISICVLLITFLLIKEINKASILTSLILILMLNFALIEKVIIKVLPMLYYWHILFIILTIIIGVAHLFKTKFSSEIAKNIRFIILVVFTGLMIINGVGAIPGIIEKNADVNIDNDLVIQKGSVKNNPNVYFFLFDEYGGHENLLRYTGYDNSPFYDALEALGFNVSKNSRNYTADTYTELPNLLNLGQKYSTNMSREVKMQGFLNPVLFRLFNENGFQLNIISDYGHIPIDSSVDYSFKTEMYEDTLENFLLKNTVYYPLLLDQYKNTRILEVESIFQYLSDSCKIQPENLFTFAYVEFPHLPWVVDEFGNNLPLSEKQNWENSDTYLGQLKFSSKKILEVVEIIIENDPEAIIVIQSDHGYRQPIYLKNLSENYDDWDLEMNYIRNILNVVYYKGEKIDIESLSGLNTLFVVLNEYFGMNFEFVK